MTLHVVLENAGGITERMFWYYFGSFGGLDAIRIGTSMLCY